MTSMFYLQVLRGKLTPTEAPRAKSTQTDRAEKDNNTVQKENVATEVKKN